MLLRVEFCWRTIVFVYEPRRILHGGKLDSVALTRGLRTVAKLAGAGMDRVTHAHYVQHVKPLDLIAKANSAFATVDRAELLVCVELLEMS